MNGLEKTGLEIAGVSHRFGPIVAADDVDLEVRPGQVHCLLGPSGSGKSTLLRLVAGLEKLQSGSVSIGGEIVADAGPPKKHLAPEKRAVGFVFQDYALFPHLDARHNVAFGMKSGSTREKLRRADAWLERVDLPGHRRAMPHTLSGGQQQRVALARALARQPQVMLLDEPFSGLDQQLRAGVRRTTLALLRETGAATLMITHDPREALLAGDRVSVIRTGRLLQTAAPDAVYRRPVSRDVAEIFGPINVLRARAENGRVRTPWGPLETGALETGALERASDGDAEILIRPDALQLSPPPMSAPTGESGRGLRGTIREIVAAGALATVIVQLEDGAERLEVQDLARRGWRVGEAVDVALVGGGAWVLPAGSV